MTFCLACAADRWALVASDTRARLWAGGYVDEDDGPSKISRLPGGWACGGGWTELRDTAVRALERADLREPETVLAALRAAHPEIAGLLATLGDELPPGLAPVMGSATLREGVAATARLTTIADTGTGFICRYYDVGRASLCYEIADAVVTGYAPGGLGVDDVQPLVAGLSASFGIVRPDVCGGIRMTAATFADVYARAGPEGSVSASVTFGLLSRGRDGDVQAASLRPMPTTWFYKRPDDELRLLMAPAPEPQRLTEDPWTVSSWHPDAD